MAGNVDVMFVTLSSAAQFVKAGKLKGLAVTTTERVASLPDVPTVVELGFPEDVSGSWQGLFAVAERRRRSSPSCTPPCSRRWPIRTCAST